MYVASTENAISVEPTPPPPTPTAAQGWVERYKVDRISGVAELLTFIIQVHLPLCYETNISISGWGYGVCGGEGGVKKRHQLQGCARDGWTELICQLLGRTGDTLPSLG